MPLSTIILAALVILHAAGTPAPLPVSAHNCYPLDGRGNARLVEALKLGIDNIEIDLGWDEAGKRLIVGHDDKPRPEATYPEFEAYLVPALEAHWQSPRADKAPTVLTIDWKTSQPAAVRHVKEFLDHHPDWFSTAPKAEKSPLTVRRLTVCFTGSDAAKDLYDSMIEPGGTYRAFRDSVFTANAYHADVKSYALHPASAYHRFLTFHWANIERGGPPTAGDFTAEEAARLKALMAHAHQQGYRVRFYCLDGRLTIAGLGYHFVDLDAAIIRWRAAAEAGVDWVATDDYAEIVQALRPPKSPR